MSSSLYTSVAMPSTESVADGVPDTRDIVNVPIKPSFAASRFWKHKAEVVFVFLFVWCVMLTILVLTAPGLDKSYLEAELSAHSEHHTANHEDQADKIKQLQEKYERLRALSNGQSEIIRRLGEGLVRMGNEAISATVKKV